MDGYDQCARDDQGHGRLVSGCLVPMQFVLGNTGGTYLHTYRHTRHTTKTFSAALSLLQLLEGIMTSWLCTACLWASLFPLSHQSMALLKEAAARGFWFAQRFVLMVWRSGGETK